MRPLELEISVGDFTFTVRHRRSTTVVALFSQCLILLIVFRAFLAWRPSIVSLGT
jgi:hypothetical protein